MARRDRRRLLGDGLEQEPNTFPDLEYYLGPDGLGIDEETLILEFDPREGRLVGGEVAQG